MTADELALVLFRSKGVLEPSKSDRERMYGSINESLDNHAGKTVAHDGGRPRRWRVLAG
jgi:hypothetical protein